MYEDFKFYVLKILLESFVRTGRVDDHVRKVYNCPGAPTCIKILLERIRFQDQTITEKDRRDIISLVMKLLDFHQETIRRLLQEGRKVWINTEDNEIIRDANKFVSEQPLSIRLIQVVKSKNDSCFCKLLDESSDSEFRKDIVSSVPFLLRAASDVMWRAVVDRMNTRAPCMNPEDEDNVMSGFFGSIISTISQNGISKKLRTEYHHKVRIMNANAQKTDNNSNLAFHSALVDFWSRRAVGWRHE